MANHGYYLPLAADVFESVHFLGIAPRTDGTGENRTQKQTKDGDPYWTLTLLIKRAGSIPEVELFSMVAPTAAYQQLKNLAPMTQVTLEGLEAGKWSRTGTDRTTWSFRVYDIHPVK